MPYKMTEARREYNRLWRIRNPGYHKQHSSVWRKKNRLHKNEYNLAWRQGVTDTLRRLYGTSCRICGLSDEASLITDHIREDGGKERKTYGRHGWKLRAARNYQPDHFQTLCASCNQSKNFAHRRALKAGLTPKLRPFGNGGLAWEGFRDLGWLERQMATRNADLRGRMDKLTRPNESKPENMDN